MKTIRAAVVVIAGFGSAPALLAETVQVLATKDNTLIFSPTGDASNALGAIYAGNVGFNGSFSVRRGLIWFDVAGAVPAGATIDSVSVTLNVSNTRDFGSLEYALHRVTSDWGEGNSVGLGQGGQSTEEDATWIHTFYPTQTWATPGGDYVSASSGSAVVGTFGPATFASSAGLVADVQNWLNTPASNFGWLLRATNESLATTVRAFDSHETGGEASGPTLIVQFTPGLLPGDANGNGVIDADDFSLIDRGFANSLTGFANGDFNNDGLINASDYAIIDNAFAAQGGYPLSPDLLSLRLTTFGPSYLDLLLPATIPEPAGLAVLAIPALTALRRRRHGD